MTVCVGNLSLILSPNHFRVEGREIWEPVEGCHTSDQIAIGLTTLTFVPPLCHSLLLLAGICRWRPLGHSLRVLAVADFGSDLFSDAPHWVGGGVFHSIGAYYMSL